METTITRTDVGGTTVTPLSRDHPYPEHWKYVCKYGRRYYRTTPRTPGEYRDTDKDDHYTVLPCRRPTPHSSEWDHRYRVIPSVCVCTRLHLPLRSGQVHVRVVVSLLPHRYPLTHDRLVVHPPPSLPFHVYPSPDNRPRCGDLKKLSVYDGRSCPQSYTQGPPWFRPVDSDGRVRSSVVVGPRDLLRSSVFPRVQFDRGRVVVLVGWDDSRLSRGFRSHRIHS